MGASKAAKVIERPYESVGLGKDFEDTENIITEQGDVKSNSSNKDSN